MAALACTLAALAALVTLGAQPAFNAPFYVLILAGAAGAVTFLLWRQEIESSALVLLGAAVAHVVTFAAIPGFIDDYFRFIWDGWRTLQIGTPYGAAPEAFFVGKAVPEYLRPVLDSINNPEYPTIYGPVLQFAFAAVFAVFGPNPLGLQLLFAAVNLLLIAMLLRRHAPGQVALYAWNPMVIADTSLHLHPDGLLSAALFAALCAGRHHPVIVGVFFAAAAGVKLVALAAWPMLVRLRPVALITAISVLLAVYLIFALQGQGTGFETTTAFATLWHFNPLAYEGLFQLLGWQAARLPAFALAGVIVVWLHARSRSLDDVPLAAIFGVILLFAPAVNSWYLLWLLPFAVGRLQIWPFAATVALPFSYLTGYALDDPALDAFAVHPLARLIEAGVLVAAIIYDWRMHRRKAAGAATSSLTQIKSPKIAVVIPALNEEAAVGTVVLEIRAALGPHLHHLIVADNGSTDRTADIARDAGASVVSVPERGYGSACLAALQVADGDSDIILFLDSDGSDVIADAVKIIAPITCGTADLVIGSRVAGKIERGAMTVPQRFGNWLAPLLVRLIWGVRYTDLGPFRAIRRDALERLTMQDRDFGWTIEMQVRAAKQGLRIAEVPTGYRRRIGVSKISGTVRGVILAGTKILYVIGREAFGNFDRLTDPRRCHRLHMPRRSGRLSGGAPRQRR